MSCSVSLRQLSLPPSTETVTCPPSARKPPAMDCATRASAASRASMPEKSMPSSSAAPSAFSASASRTRSVRLSVSSTSGLMLMRMVP